MAKRKAVYTDAMIAAMCDSRIYWAAELRQAAKQRKLSITSVTPLNDIVDALRATLSKESA